MKKIQRDRNDQMKQRQLDSEKLIIRNKTLINEINHRHMNNLKKLQENIHNICFDMGSQKK